MFDLNLLLQTLILFFTGIAVGVLVWALFIPSRKNSAKSDRRNVAVVEEKKTEFGYIRRARMVYPDDGTTRAKFMNICAAIGKTIGGGSVRQELVEIYARASWPKNMSDDQLLGLVYFSAIWVSLIYAMAFLRISPILLVGAPFFGFAMSYIFIKTWIHMTIEKRFADVSRMMPYVMDILSMTMNAGASLQKAMELIVMNYGSHPIGEEFDAVLYDLERGASMTEAMTGFRQRLLPVPIAQGFADEIINALKFGRPIASLLENSSSKYKKLRVTEAQDKAGKARVKILVPGFLILIGGLIILLGPFILKFMDDVNNLGFSF